MDFSIRNIFGNLPDQIGEIITNIQNTFSQNSTAPVPKLAPEGEAYLNGAYDCIQKVYPEGFQDKPVLLCRVAAGMKCKNTAKARELFQQALKTATSDINVFAMFFAQTIHLSSIDCLEEAKKAVTSLTNSWQGRDTLNYYLRNYGEKNSPITKHCIEKFKQWGDSDDSALANFASSCSGFDFDYFLEVLKTIKDVKVSANAIIQAADSKKHQIDRAVFESYILQINQAIAIQPNNQDLKLIQLKLNLLNGMTIEEVEKWISLFVQEPKADNLWSPKNKALEALGLYVKNSDLKRAFDISLLHSEPSRVLEKILTSLAIDEIELVKTYIDRITDPDRIKQEKTRLRLWLSVASNSAKSSPEAVKRLLPDLITMVDNFPDSEELYWEPGRGRRRDAKISYIDEKIGFMDSVIQIHFDIGALEGAEQLKNHRLFKMGRAISDLKYKLMEANYYKEKDRNQAERLYNEAWKLSDQVNCYDWNSDDIKEKIALPLIDLRPELALEIAMTMGEKSTINRMLLKFIESTAKNNREFAKKCLEQMKEGPFEAKDKVKGYLELIWA